jgi:hypothetical protein
VAAAAELGQEQRDVEGAGQDSSRPVGRWRGSEWHVSEGSGARLHGGGLRGYDGEVRCTGGRRLLGGRRGKVGKAGTWAGSGEAGEEATRGSDQGSAEAAGRRTWPGSGGGMRQRRNRGGRERGRRRRTQLQFQRNTGTLL